ncbi:MULTISPECIES: tRNA lysidine(34) synthetase TilS [unclassified Novosphingobium]|uniref:tRNA lysidine(34) synthetase TilS n=1 Tax=unclassified Novosphingobium TaxID=2644732 RepID=UPI0014419A6B|nr:tRNA(Ile)-lysidine synthase [Novosphingobium sp. BK256]MBB3375264.1 tRNA(Ile)-lysidine synthase [Novosphingobium sp. BK280]MBB3380028.1 tRNA(Ile)-lysidine synthase [Novosphingobium sp. BK258]MBB3421722.1 tRNA(Ile)-lysidine synthase [Novosphingobium sp. BK267]MBB3450037.1 tRNA(Ile)-lysidine synthase [Novosphingobium sp. BK352]MBB3478538.1 tRNA(Ile)-lysidine synthase [Novosphingobium sp. BK369]MBB3501852.1 tRNA(Ile)-lysidine synthase [Novosphingobium sp. BK336]MBB3537987.1 tRNA(Ile)-lysidin
MGLAVSGGPDSCALLLLAAAHLPGQIAVATVDHGLRAQAADEARAVAALCADLGVPHHTLRVDLGGGSAIQARARAARYAALAGWARGQGLAALATAHHMDDQAETLAMRLNRGAGVRGLAGMRARAGVPGDPALPLLRPLLGWRRAELAAVVASAGVVAADDPSNQDTRFERVRVRFGLAGAAWLDTAGWAASAQHLAQADAALDWAAQRLFAQGWDEAHGRLAVPDGLPQALALRVLELVLNAMGATPVPRGGELVRWHAALAAGQVATLAGLRGEGKGATWHFLRVPPHRAG